MAKSIATKNNPTSRGARYIVITIKGLDFTEKWFQAKQVPSRITKVYQLLLKLIHTKGVMAVNDAERMGYGGRVIDQALSSGYVEVAGRRTRLSKDIQNKIVEIIGKAPEKFYV